MSTSPFGVTLRKTNVSASNNMPPPPPPVNISSGQPSKPTQPNKSSSSLGVPPPPVVVNNSTVDSNSVPSWKKPVSKPSIPPPPPTSYDVKNTSTSMHVDVTTKTNPTTNVVPPPPPSGRFTASTVGSRNVSNIVSPVVVPPPSTSNHGIPKPPPIANSTKLPTVNSVSTTPNVIPKPPLSVNNSFTQPKIPVSNSTNSVPVVNSIVRSPSAVPVVVKTYSPTIASQSSQPPPPPSSSSVIRPKFAPQLVELPPLFNTPLEEVEYYKKLCEKYPEVKSGKGFTDIQKPAHICKTYKDSGSSSLQLSLQDYDPNYSVKASQYQEDDGVSFSLDVYVSLYNPNNYYVLTRDIEMFYQDVNGKWIPARYPAYRARGTRFHHDTALIVDGRERLDMAFCGTFPILKNQKVSKWGDDFTDIVHESLPQPLLCKVVIHDKLGESKELIVEQFNSIEVKKPNPTHLKILKEMSEFKKGSIRYGLPLVEHLNKTVFCEDIYSGGVKFVSFGFQSYERHGCETSKPNRIEVEYGNMSSSTMGSESHEMNWEMIEKFEEKAKRGNKNEIPFPHFQSLCEITLLFDRGVMYGARVGLKQSQIVQKIVLLRDLILIIKGSQ